MDEDGHDVTDRDEPEDSGAHRPIEFPTWPGIARLNRLIGLIDDQRRENQTPPTELTKVDRRPLEDLGFTQEEIDNAASTTATWEKMALSDFGRIGRDPARIEPFLAHLGEIWKRHPSVPFAQLISDAMTEGWGGLRLAAPEDDAFERLLADWDGSRPAQVERDGTAADPSARRRDTEQISSFLSRLGQAWAKEPDMRFGQFVANIFRPLPSLEGFRLMPDEDFLEMLNEWEGSL